MLLIEEHISQVHQLCNKYKVKLLYVFGSVLSDQFKESSDIDMVVEFLDMPPLDYLDNYFNLKFALEDLFQRDVDLLEANALSNPYFIEELEKKRKLVYDYRDFELVA